MGARDIQRGDCEISQAVRSGQVAMFDLAERKYGFTAKRLHLETDISDSTLRGWMNGTSMMPLDGLAKIAAVKGFPNALLSLPFENVGKAISDAESEDADERDFAALARSAVRLLDRYVTARDPDSPGGTAIIHNEKPDLKLAAADLADRAANAA